jgi:lysozyme
MRFPDWRPQRTPRSKAAAAAAICALAGACLAPFEGRVLHTYPDAVYGWKLPTACDGHTGPELQRGQTFTNAECDEMRTADLTKTYDAIAPCFGTVAISDREWAAYLSLAYNVGPQAVCRSTIPRKVHAGQRIAACDTILQFNRAGGQVLAGLVRRRAAENALCLQGLRT